MQEGNKKGRKPKEKNYNTPFAKRLRQLLDDCKINRGTSLDDIASKIEITRQSLGQYKDGNNVPDIITFQKLAKYFKVSYDYLLGETEVRSVDSNIKVACELTGLNDLSFFRLQHIKNIQKQMDIFNELASPLLFEELLNNINTLMQQTVELKSIEKEYPNFKDEEIKADLSQCCFKEEFEARQTHQRLKLSTFTSRYIIEEQFKKLYLLAVEAQTE